MNILAAIAHFEHFGLEAHAFALFADQFHIGEKLHFDHHGSVALAGFAASAGDVERKVTRSESSLVCLGSGCEKLANSVKSLDVGNRVRARGTSDWGLVDQHDLIDKLMAFEASEGERLRGGRRSVRGDGVEHLQ